MDEEKLNQNPELENEENDLAKVPDQELENEENDLPKFPDQELENEEELSGIYKVHYEFGVKNENTKKFPLAFVRVTANSKKEALEKAIKNGISSNQKLHKWLDCEFEKEV